MSGTKIAVLMFAAAAMLACDNEPLNLGSRNHLALQASQSGTQLPFHGSYTVENSSVFTPPTTLQIYGTATGHAIQVGRFTVVSVDIVDITTATSTGTFNLTAANGDQLFTTTTGGETEFIPPNVSQVTLVATIVGGTGRFAAATGTFTINATIVIDFATGTSSGSGSLEGHINLNR